MNVTPEVAKYVERRAHAIRFFRTDKSTFSGKYGEVKPYREYTCCLQEDMQEKLASAEIKALPEAERFAAAWEEVRYCAIRRFVSIAQALCRWEELRRRHSLSACEDFIDTGWTDMRTVVAQIARSFDLGDSDTHMIDFVKRVFSIDYHWRMLRLFRILQRTDDREDKISPAMVRAMDGLVLEAGSKPSIYTQVFAESYFSGYLFPRESVHKIVGTIFGRMIKPDFLMSAAIEQGADPVAIETILKSCNPVTDLQGVPMFGNKSIFRNFPDRRERELKALKDSFDALRARGYAAKQEYCELRSVPKMTNLLRNALAQGLIHPDWVAMTQAVRALIDLLRIDHLNLDVNECTGSLNTVEADYQRAVQKLEAVPA